MTILVAVGDDDLREQVVSVGVEFGRAFEQDLYVVYLTDDEVADAEAREIRSELDETLADTGVEYDVGVEHIGYRTGRPGKSAGKQLAEIATDVTITHVVVGHQSRPTIRRLARGDTAYAVVKEASVPVTIVPDDADGSIE